MEGERLKREKAWPVVVPMNAFLKLDMFHVSHMEKDEVEHRMNVVYVRATEQR